MKIKYLSTGMALACALALSACGGGDDDFPDVRVGVELRNVTEKGLTLKLNGGTAETVTEGSVFYFANKIPANSRYKVELGSTGSKPDNATECTVTGGEGIVGILEPAGIVVSCKLVTYKLGGTITGVARGKEMIINNGSAQLTVAATDTTFLFPEAAQVPAKVPYSVTILKQPEGKTCVPSPAQTAPVAIAAPAGFMPAQDLTTLNIHCTEKQ